MGQATFELGAGAICLDLANTWGGRPDPSAERLNRYEDLVAWALETGSVTADEADVLLAEAVRQPERARRVLAGVRELRESVYRVLAARARGDTPGEDDLLRVNRALERAMPRLRVRPGCACCGWSWEFAPHDLDRPAWPAVRSTAEMLTSEEGDRLHECEARDCTWLFVDRSRGRRRRWCDMATCGNREKARRHYRRRREAEDTAGS